jgi:carbon starvation protein CstA
VIKMVCYVVPAVAAVVHGILRKKIPGLKNDPKQQWLSFLLIGATVFGAVDHLWNGELFLIGKDVMSDIMLGFAILATVLVVWGIFVVSEKIAEKSKVKQMAYASMQR